MSFLSEEEIRDLLMALTGDDRRVVVLCLNTGARWGEASNLKAEHVISNRVTFVKTKTGPARTVPISQEIADYILRANQESCLTLTMNEFAMYSVR